MKILVNNDDYVKWNEDGEDHIAMKNPHYWGTNEQAYDTFHTIRESIRNPKKIKKNINHKLKKI